MTTTIDLLSSWEVVDPQTGEGEDYYYAGMPQGWVGYAPPKTVKDVHRILTHGTVIDRGGDRMRYGGATEELKARCRRTDHAVGMSAEDQPPHGWAADWYWALRKLSPSANSVARQLARLAEGRNQVTISSRRLADAVGRVDRAGRLRAFTERGVEELETDGFVVKTVTGKGRGARTHYQLVMPE